MHYYSVRTLLTRSATPNTDHHRTLGYRSRYNSCSSPGQKSDKKTSSAIPVADSYWAEILPVLVGQSIFNNPIAYMITIGEILFNNFHIITLSVIPFISNKS